MTAAVPGRSTPQMDQPRQETGPEAGAPDLDERWDRGVPSPVLGLVLRALAGGALIQLALTGLIRLDAPSPAEPVAWRWARVLVDHPVRGALALGLLRLAARPGRASFSQRAPAIRSVGRGSPSDALD